MKFKVLSPKGFLHGAVRYENGNTHDSDNIDDMTDEHVKAYHRAGFVGLEGCDDCERDIHHSELVVDSTVHAHDASEIS
mgnify:CR=1 FL=1